MPRLSATRRAAVATMTVAAALAVPSVSSVQAAGPVCRLLTDPAGDQSFFGAAPAGDVSGGDLDVLSADVAADSRHLVVAIRLASFRRYDPTSPHGRRYEVSFTVDNVRYTMTGLVTLQAATAWVTSDDGRGFPATLSLDPEAAEIRMHAQVGRFGTPSLARGRLVRSLSVESKLYTGVYLSETNGPVVLWVGEAGWGLPVDEASTSRTYRGGSPTCVRMPT